MVIDIHGHVGEYKRHYSEVWERIIGGFWHTEESMWNIKPEDVIKDMDENGVDKMVILGLDITFANIATHIDPDYIYEAYLQRWPDRFIGFAAVQPFNDFGLFSQEKIRAFKRAITELGFKGMKTSPCYCDFTPSDPRIYPYYQLCAEYGIPVLLHMGTTSFSPAKIEYGNPCYLERPSKDFPDVKFCAAHFSYPWDTELMGLMRGCPNIWTDISVQVVRPYRLARTIFEAKESGLIDRVMYGTDYPCTKQAQAIKFVRTDLNNILKSTGYPTLTEDEIEGILWKNAKRFLNI